MAGINPLQPHNSGFTLAELLIALVILGVIATFTIPKVLSSQQDAKYTAICKESAAMVSGAYDAYRRQDPAASLDNVGVRELTPFMNYVAVDSTSTIDRYQTATNGNCWAPNLCLRLHNGAIMRYQPAINFGWCSPGSKAIWFHVDPDGLYSGTTNGPGKAVEFRLYQTGRITTRGQIDPNTCDSLNPDATLDPPWFGWN